ncbi:MAG: hypothetical protein ACKOEQ_17740 [Verrucomicrobiota bacterium]
MKSLSRILSTAVLGLIVSAHLFAQDGNGGGDNNNGGGGGRRNRGGQGGGPGGPGGPGGGNWDPAQMRQRMMERMREQFAVKDDAEWKLISERIEKVNDARRESMMRGMGMMFGRGGRGPGGQGGGEAMPEQEALQKAIEANASSDEIKSKLNKYREALKAKEAVLTKAQDELREVLSAKQEAQAVLMGLLK